MSSRRYILLIILLYIFTSPLNTLDGQISLRPEIINYPTAVYQAQSQNWSVTQNEDGLLFFANNEGLLSYDGAAWHHYPMPENQIVRAVAADGHGRVYGGGFGVFGYWEKNAYGGFRFQNLSSLVKDPMFEAEEIWKILPAANFILFQSFSRIHLLHNGRVKTIVAPATILYTYQIRDHFYVQVLGKGLFRISENETLEPVSDAPFLTTKRITLMLPYGTREILMGTEREGLFIMDPMTGSLSAFHTAADPLLKNGEVNAGVKLGDDLYAIGTIGEGVVFMNTRGEKKAIVNKKSGLLNNTILGMYPDKEGNLWLAMDKGIAQLVLKSNVAYFKDLQGRIGTVYAVAPFAGRLYVGSNHGLYSASYNGMAGFDLSKLQEVPGIRGQVWDLKVIDGTLFCGNNTGTYTVTAGGIQKISGLPGGWDLVAAPGRGNGNLQRLLQGTYNGIAVYQKKNSQWQFTHVLKGTENMAVSKMAIDSNGQIWAMHAYKGIYLLRPDSGYQDLLSSTMLPLKTLGPTTLRWSIFTFKGTVHLAGTAGIFKWAGDSLVRDKRLEAYFSPFNKPVAIFRDKESGYWVLDAQHQLHYKGSSGEWTHFALNTHLFNMVRGFESITAINKTESLVTGEDGFALLHKTQRTLPVNLPAPSFRQIMLMSDGKPASLDKKYIQPDGSLILPYRENNLLISYSLPYYEQPVTYSFRLKGSDQDTWSIPSVAGWKELNNLPAGRYSFEVRSSLSDKIASLDIWVLNPWYYSVVARCVYFLLLVMVCLLLWRGHKHRLKLQRQAMTRKMREALQLQREKNANQLLLLEQKKLSEEVLHKSEDLAKLAMELIKKKKVLKRLKDELDHMKAQKDQDAQVVDSRIQKLSKSLNKYIQDEQADWQLFDNGFSKVHEAFFEKLVQAYPELTAQDLRLAAYLKMNLSTKEIAPLLNISVRGVEIKRYRLRKKLRLEVHDNLSDFMLRF